MSSKRFVKDHLCQNVFKTSSKRLENIINVLDSSSCLAFLLGTERKIERTLSLSQHDTIKSRSEIKAKQSIFPELIPTAAILKSCFHCKRNTAIKFYLI